MMNASCGLLVSSANSSFGPQKWDRDRRKYLPYWADEVEEANLRVWPWAQELMLHTQVAPWLRVWPEANAKVAAAFNRAGVPPEMAMTPLWFGQVRPGRPALAIRVSTGDISFEDAVGQLRAAGLLAEAERS